MITGTLTQNADAKTFTASISTMMFDIARVAVVTNGYKTAENHPDYHLEVRTPRGRTMRVGSMWKAVSEKSGRAYFSLGLTDRMGRTSLHLSAYYGHYDVSFRPFCPPCRFATRFSNVRFLRWPRRSSFAALPSIIRTSEIGGLSTGPPPEVTKTS